MPDAYDRKTDRIVRARRVVLPDGIRPASIHINDGTIAKVSEWHDIGPAGDICDCNDDVILPGIVDLHAHINEPGRTDWEGFESATRAAAAGGITTLVDMPLNSIPPTVDSSALEEKIKAADGKLWIDIGFHGGIVPGNAAKLPELVRNGVIGLKCFLCDSGVAEFPAVTLEQLGAAHAAIKPLDPWILVHAESPEVLAAARREISGGAWGYDEYLRSRPDEAECAAIRKLIALTESSGARIHIVHLSSAAALPLIRQAKARGLPITVETCPHYLTFAAEAIAQNATELKCAPPIRSAANRDTLWQGLRDGIIDFIASDHSPCTPDLKLAQDFSHAWGGIASLQCSLSAVWTEAQRRKFSLEDLARWMCQRPAELGGLLAKGSITSGKNADLVRFAPNESFEFRTEQIIHRHKVTPYANRTLRGVVKQTFLRGALIYDHGSFATSAFGKIIKPDRRST